MDAEGFEEDILKGGKNTIENNDELQIITEYNPGRLIAAGTTPESFIDTILNFGFSIFILEESKGTIEKINGNELLQKVKADNEYPFPRHTNLYLTK